MTKKTAIVLFNLGGPDELKSVKPFLFNLFYDPAIIGLPNPFRYLLAKFISGTRAAKSRKIYSLMGGKSPILEQTNLQAQELENKLAEMSESGNEYKVFVSMRYWHPMSDMVVKKVKNYAPDEIILLPLYPQFSTTTTASSFNDWEASASQNDLNVPTRKICCYPTDFGFVAAHAKMIRDSYWKASETGKPRVLFSAHGLPEKIVDGGDPYQFQVEKTVEAVSQILAIENMDYEVCYQSKVGRMKWLTPSLDSEIRKAGAEKIPLVVVPISFVSEHSETLVELDIDYQNLANEVGVTGYERVPALGIEPLFIETLADLCLNIKEERQQICSSTFEKCYCMMQKNIEPKMEEEAV